MSGRDSKGLFKPGHNVARNPGGPSKSEILRAMLEPHREEVVAKLIENAKAGEPNALRIYFDRLAPPPKPESEKVIVPGLKEAPTLKAKSAAIMAAVADGVISCEAGDRLLSMIGTYARALIADEAEARLLKAEGKKHRVLPSELILDDDIDLEDLI